MSEVGWELGLIAKGWPKGKETVLCLDWDSGYTVMHKYQHSSNYTLNGNDFIIC